MIKTVYKIKVEGANRFVGFRPTAAKDRFEIIVIYLDKVNQKWYCYVLSFFDLKDGKMEPLEDTALLEQEPVSVLDAYNMVVSWIKDHQEIIGWDCSWYEKGAYEEELKKEPQVKGMKNDGTADLYEKGEGNKVQYNFPKLLSDCLFESGVDPDSFSVIYRGSGRTGDPMNTGIFSISFSWENGVYLIQ